MLFEVGYFPHQIPNPRMWSEIEAICHGENYELPILCTPEELMAG
jgi:hypothetical protein